MEDERIDKYWICAACAQKRGWYVPEGNCNTVISGLCGHCMNPKEQTLTPTCDYSSLDKKKKAIWD